MLLSVIIVNWNTCDLLANCLASVYRAIPIVQGLVEILVVDNSSYDDSKNMVRQQFPEVNLICNQENVGFARANNQAINASQGKYLLLLNSDTIIFPNSLRHLLSCAETQPDVAIVGPTLLNADGTFQASYGRFPSFLSYFWQLIGIARLVYGPYFPSASPEVSQQQQDVDWVGGACLLCRRIATDKAGLLDEHFFMYAEEMDWCYRIKQHGWRVCFTPKTSIVHLGGGSSKIVRPKVLAQQWRANLHFLHKHYNPLIAYAIQTLMVIVGCLRGLLFFIVALLDRKRKEKWWAKVTENVNLIFLRTS